MLSGIFSSFFPLNLQIKHPSWKQKAWSGPHLKFTEVAMTLAGHLPPRLWRRAYWLFYPLLPSFYPLLPRPQPRCIQMEDWEEERGELWEKSSTQEERWSPFLPVRGGNTLNNWGTFAGKKADLIFLGWTSAQLTDLPCWDPGGGAGEGKCIKDW